MTDMLTICPDPCWNPGWRLLYHCKVEIALRLLGDRFPGHLWNIKVHIQTKANKQKTPLIAANVPLDLGTNKQQNPRFSLCCVCTK